MVPRSTCVGIASRVASTVPAAGRGVVRGRGVGAGAGAGKNFTAAG